MLGLPPPFYCTDKNLYLEIEHYLVVSGTWNYKNFKLASMIFKYIVADS
jgi:hypothetical protein